MNTVRKSMLRVYEPVKLYPIQFPKKLTSTMMTFLLLLLGGVCFALFYKTVDFFEKI